MRKIILGLFLFLVYEIDAMMGVSNWIPTEISSQQTSTLSVPIKKVAPPPLTRRSISLKNIIHYTINSYLWFNEISKLIDVRKARSLEDFTSEEREKYDRLDILIKTGNWLSDEEIYGNSNLL